MTLNVTYSPDGFYTNGETDGPIPMPFTKEIPQTGDNHTDVSTNQMASTVYTGDFVLTLEIN